MEIPHIFDEIIIDNNDPFIPIHEQIKLIKKKKKEIELLNEKIKIKIPNNKSKDKLKQEHEITLVKTLYYSYSLNIYNEKIKNFFKDYQGSMSKTGWEDVIEKNNEKLPPFYKQINKINKRYWNY
jgi:hypothetical protein